MLFGHSYFSLNPARRRVKDEHGKTLRITGNPYRLLELLCQRYPESLTITDINLAFDPAGATEYTEAHVRSMKNHIHTAIGREVIGYRNHVYSLIGEVRKIEGTGVTGTEVMHKGPAPLSVGKLQVLSIEQKQDSLRIVIQTPGGGRLVYINNEYQGIF